MRLPQGLEFVIFMAFSLLPALVPIVIAYLRRTTNRTMVLLVAVLTSWTCIGWAIAVSMALIGQPQKPAAMEQDVSGRAETTSGTESGD